jgi:hypothetical protein
VRLSDADDPSESQGVSGSRHNLCGHGRKAYGVGIAVAGCRRHLSESSEVCGDETCETVRVQLGHQVLARLEVMRDRTDGDVGTASDIDEAESRLALVLECLEGGSEDALSAAA